MATNTQPDYSESIIIPGKIPEHMEAHYTALKRAKKVIHILSQSALSAKTRAYSILHGTHEDMILPEQYQFERFVIRFLPGWGTYSVILEDDAELSLRNPHGKEEFETDLGKIESFLAQYYKLPRIQRIYREPRQSEYRRHHAVCPENTYPLSPREKALIEFKRQLREAGRGFY